MEYLLGSSPFVYKNICFNNRKGISVFNSNSIVRKNIVSMDYIDGFGILIEAFNSSYYPVIDSNYISVSKPSAVGIHKNLSSTPTIKNNLIVLKNGGADGIISGIGGISNIYNNLIIAESGFDGIYKNGSVVQVINNYVTGTFGDYGILVSSNPVKNNVVTGAANGIGTGGSSGSAIQYNNSWNNDINYPGFTPDYNKPFS